MRELCHLLSPNCKHQADALQQTNQSNKNTSHNTVINRAQPSQLLAKSGLIQPESDSPKIRCQIAIKRSLGKQRHSSFFTCPVQPTIQRFTISGLSSDPPLKVKLFVGDIRTSDQKTNEKAPKNPGGGPKEPDVWGPWGHDLLDK